jgi:hypothetical protein
MTARTHKGIALGPTGNLQGSVKFYCLKTGRVLKRRSFTPMPMPARVKRRVDAIGAREGQGRQFRFLNRRREPYEWSDEVLEDDPEFQGLLDETEDTAVFPDVSAELPGVELEENEQDFRTVTEDQDPDFPELAGAALHNAGIDAADAIRRAREHDLPNPGGPTLVEADKDEIVYELTFDLRDAGLAPAFGAPGEPLGDERDDTLVAAVPTDNDASVGRRYPS